jgi:hypothetical protein
MKNKQPNYDIKQAFHSLLIQTLNRLDIEPPEGWELGYYWLNKKAGLFQWSI